MRITFVLPYAGLAGGIRVVAIYAQRLRQRGHEVTIVSKQWLPPGRRARFKHRLRWLVQQLRLPWESLRDPSHLDGLNIPHIRVPADQPITDAHVPDGDVVVATWWETANWVARMSPRKGAKAYFVQDYGGAQGQPLDAIAATWSLPLHKIAISKWLIQLVRDVAGLSADEQIDYVPNAVDLEIFNAPPRDKQPRPTVGFLYSSAPQKGCDVILEAIRLASREIADLRIVSFGPGDSLPKAARECGIEYFPYMPDERLREVYGTCDAWLFGSRREGFGLPILEAMACRTPVIATPAGAAPELLASGGGIMVPPENAQEMAQAIRRIADMPQGQWKAMSDAAYAVATGYTWDDATDLFEASLQQAISLEQPHPLRVA